MPDATERKVLAASAFLASLMLFPLGGRLSSITLLFRERIAACSALVLALALTLVHVLLTRREEAEAESKAATPPRPLDPPEPPVAAPPEAGA